VAKTLNNWALVGRIMAGLVNRAVAVQAAKGSGLPPVTDEERAEDEDDERQLASNMPAEPSKEALLRGEFDELRRCGLSASFVEYARERRKDFARDERLVAAATSHVRPWERAAAASCEYDECIASGMDLRATREDFVRLSLERNALHA